jgi:uncharacterized protein (DUF1015 family)
LTNIFGLAGWRPAAAYAAAATCPPYDVIKPGSRLEALLRANGSSLYHVTLGQRPAAAWAELLERGVMLPDELPGFYVYEQSYGGQRRLGVLAAVEVTPYERREIIRHEKTFDDKVRGRIALMEETGAVTEPIWLLTRAGIGELLAAVAAGEPLYQFTSDFQGESELSGIQNRIFKVAADSERGEALAAMIRAEALYVADGHHRYHSALRMGLRHCIAYICQADHARIQAYNRVIRGRRPFGEIRDQLPLRPAPVFDTPARHQFILRGRDGCWSYQAERVNEADPVERLDCRILERTLYPLLGLEHSLINDPAYFDYYPEQDLGRMERAVDEGSYDLAVALHPVSPAELMAVADAGIVNPDIVMPEKSTFFAPKILSGLIVIPTERRK